MTDTQNSAATTRANQTDFNNGLLAFLAAAPTPFHAVTQMTRKLDAAGFQALREDHSWTLQPGGRYYCVRNGSSIIAWQQGTAPVTDTGIRLIGAHTDSPCLRVKPHPELNRQGYWQLGVETYGGVLLNPWFDRDLSLAGRVTYRADDDRLRSALIDFQRPIATVASLAIHLDREANKGREINPQQHLPPVVMCAGEDRSTDFRALLLQQLLAEHPDSGAQAVLDYELSFYDTQPPALIGLHHDFIASARLDNLLSCFVGLHALLDSDPAVSTLLVCNDHEEVGSMSSSGAQGPFLNTVLARWLPEADQRAQALDRSMLISADNAHGVHPNFSDRHDDNHGPRLNAGPVIKLDTNQRYATNSETAAQFRHLCAQEKVPVQAFVTRTDMACGSTIGPLTAGTVGVKTLDVGVPQFAMHSIRELAGARDAYGLYQVLGAFCRLPHPPGAMAV